MSATTEAVQTAERPRDRLSTLPGDDVRQAMWRFAHRYDLQMLVQSARGVARGPVAHLVADGARHSHEWTEGKQRLLEAFDASGITSVFMEPEHGGYIEGPKNLALALAAFELSWVDGGAATSSLAGHLGLSPIHEKGTEEQKAYYMSRAASPPPDGAAEPWRGAFCLTEPLPYVGVDTGVLSGRIRVAEWNDGEEPILQADKRGRFITNMDFANFVTAAVASDDERIKGSCLVILEEDDPGLYDRGAASRKLVHQLSSTRDPIFSLQVPAHRIVGGYTVKDGVIVPNYSHSEVIGAVFRRTRVTVGLMTAAKLLSAVEPVIRYHRERYRGGDLGSPGTPRYDLGLQQKEDVLHRLVDVWATGEASASLGFAAARLFDDFDPTERRKDDIFQKQGIKGARAELRALRKVQDDALEYIDMSASPESARYADRWQPLTDDPLVRYVVDDALANVLCPAVKLWNTGHGANMMREAVSLIGGYGVTEDCPGFLGNKWMDAQLEATYEGPEAVQRRQLSVTMTNEVFLAQFRNWIPEMRAIARRRPGTGACTIASAMTLWLWTLEHLRKAKDADGRPLYHDQRQGLTFAMVDALCWLLASRHQILDVIELEERGPENPNLADALPGFVDFFTDLCHVQAARGAGEVGRICAELVFGYNRHPSWDDDEACADVPVTSVTDFRSEELDAESAEDPMKAGPCVNLKGFGAFLQMRAKLDGCLTGARLAKDRAAQALTQVMIPEALDYPL